MKNIAMLKGLKYPDEYMIKFFFKQKLHEKKGKVIEFGCSNGNNLSLFYQYGYDTTGIDYSETNVQNGNYNFTNIYESDANFSFHTANMVDYIKNKSDDKYDVFMIPNVLNYLKKSEFISFLQDAQKNKIYKDNAHFFLITRTMKDYRYGIGEEIEPNTYKIDYDTTGERGTVTTFYYEHELLGLLKKYLNLKEFTVMYLDKQNEHSGKIVLNSDIVISGQIS